MTHHHAHDRAQRRGRLARRALAVGALTLVLQAFLGGGLFVGVAKAAGDQGLWEFTPYRVQVLVTVDDDATMTTALAADLQRDVQERIEAVVGAPWDVETIPAPPTVAHAVRWRYGALLAEDLPRESLDFDKAMFVRVSRSGSGYRVAARDFDLQARVLGSAVVHDVAQRSLLGPIAADAVLEAFAPLARVEVVKQKTSEVRLRAAALPTRDPELPVLTRAKVFVPVLRSNNSDGSLKAARVIPWTFLAAEPPGRAATEPGPGAKEKPQDGAKPQPPDPATVQCRIHTGLRSPLSSRRRGRTEQLAVAVNPPRAATRLELFSASETDYPLAGYQVYAQTPDSPATTLLGLTDNRGVIQVPPADEHPLRLLIIKDGDEPVARLPVLAGWEPSLRALVTNDEQRLRVEGFITGLQERAVDTVARRDLLLARVRVRLQSGRVDEADALFQRVKALPTLTDFQQELQSFERTAQTNDPRLKRKIDKLFADTRQVLEKHLAEKQVDELAAQLSAAKGTGTASVPAAPGTGGL